MSAAAPIPPAEGEPTGLKVAVLGAGSYGTAMAVIAARKGHTVVLYVRSQPQADSINTTHLNTKRFQKIRLSSNISATTDFDAAVKDAAVIVHAIPAQHTPAFVRKFAAQLPAGVPYVSTSKGVHVESHMLMSEAIPEAMDGRATDGEKRAEVPLAYLSGPSFAKEMIAGHPMSVVVASHDHWCASRVQSVLNSKTFRIYTTDDVIGVEVGGALKNPLAIGCGMAVGLGYGQSTVAGAVVRGCGEMATLAVALGGRAETLSGLSGVGDLMLTCFSKLSRNNRFGGCLARGLTPEEGFKEIGEVVEGYPTSAEVVRLAKKHDLNLPLFFAVDAVLQGKVTPQEAMSRLMGNPPSRERFVRVDSKTRLNEMAQIA